MKGLSPFWVNNVYALGYWLKDYARYPKSWPLCTYMDHGMTLVDTIPEHELNNNAPLIFKFSPRHIDTYKKVSKKKVYCLLNPTIHCRRQRKYEQSANANGTLFYVAHSTDLVEDRTNWENFVDSLRNISTEFQPVDICLHPMDMAKGLDKIFIENGFRVFTAGDQNSNDYVDNMYKILKNYKYTMSNLLGSYVFYSVEMGIPFSYFGTEPLYYNTGDKNIELGEYKSYQTQSTYQYAKSIFTGFHAAISAEQTEF
ncbi:MAG TPA: hypothetical protein VKH37_13350, partial [Ferruginibacter sp.]|nr:hypothetical protein [Ferruginibacter sp.]